MHLVGAKRHKRANDDVIVSLNDVIIVDVMMAVCGGTVHRPHTLTDLRRDLVPHPPAAQLCTLSLILVRVTQANKNFHVHTGVVGTLAVRALVL